jgi:AcrR family transcriptional regulator
MGNLTRRQKQHRELHRKILAAAEELFARHGPEQVSMRRIAARIEYSPTTIYRFFRNREDLLGQVIRDGYDRLYRIYDEITSRKRISPLSALKEIITAYIRFGLENPNHYELWFRTSRIKVKGNDLHMVHGRNTYRVYRVWLEWIAACQQEGSIDHPDPLFVFQTAWSFVHGQISLRIHHTLFPWIPAEQAVDLLFEKLISGEKPKEES